MGPKNYSKPPPVTWRPELIGKARFHKWQNAAGQNPDGSDKNRQAHRSARAYIILKDARFQKDGIDRSICVGSQGPPVNWKPELDLESRTLAWKYAAGNNKDGSAKSNSSHARTRQHEIIRFINSKYVADRTTEEKQILQKCNLARLRQQTNLGIRTSSPAGVLQIRKSSKKSTLKILKKKSDNVSKFVEETGMDLDAGVLSDQDAFKFVLELIEDYESVVGKAIFDALGGMTLRTAFWEGGSNAAMYALTSRGAADVGGATAEYVRFLLRNAKNMPILTHTDNNKRFKYSDQEFKDLELVYCPIKSCNSFADVTTLESAFQILFDFLEIGSKRLWKVSGHGKSSLLLRKVDMKYIKDTGDKNPKFMFGITILKNVSVLRRSPNANGNDTAVSITAGRGTKCNVNWPVRSNPIVSESQREELIKAQATLPPNFMERDRMRKAGDLQ